MLKKNILKSLIQSIKKRSFPSQLSLHYAICIDAETSPSNGAIWDEFSKQYEHQCI